MASLRDLLSVTFQDATSHASSNGRDIMGVVMPYFWGPCESVRIFDRASFYDAYPESLPTRVSTVDASTHFIDAFAQIKRFFENNGTLVEVYRPLLGDKQYGIAHGDYVVTLKYPGMVPANLIPTGASALNLIVSNTDVELVAVVDGTEKVVEAWQGQFTDISAQYQGQYTHFTKVLEGSSLLQCSLLEDCPAFQALSGTDFLAVNYTLKNPISSDSKTEITSIYNNYFGDSELSQSSVLISPTCTNDFDTVISNIAAERLDLNAVVGVPTATTFDYDNIYAAKTLSSMQTFMVAGREFVTVYGMRFSLNCVGGFVGATFGIAKSVRLNQPASARTYGRYNGALAKTLKFSDVLNLHKVGVATVFNSQIGPQIFGIHNTLYQERPNSYFSLWNVTRVLASIFKDVFPMCISAIHTDTASNPVTRSQFEVQLDSVIQNYVANQNLLADSSGICSAEMNTDALTKGGKELNVLLSLHFIGLVELVNIKVVATDSSVTAEIV